MIQAFADGMDKAWLPLIDKALVAVGAFLVNGAKNWLMPCPGFWLCFLGLLSSRSRSCCRRAWWTCSGK